MTDTIRLMAEATEVIRDQAAEIARLEEKVTLLETLLEEAKSEELRELNGDYDHIKAEYFEKGRRAAQEASDE